MIHLEKVTYKNEEEVLDLNIFKEQYPFVADNSESLADAYIAITTEGCFAYPFAIYNDETLVGFLMIGYNVSAIDDEIESETFNNNYLFWRFMIDKRYQKNGYGREAMRLAIEFVKSFPSGKAEYLVTSYNPENEVAKKLYSSFGFEENGEVDDGEVVALLKL